MDILGLSFLENTVATWLTTLLVFVLIYLGLLIFKRLILLRLSKLTDRMDANLVGFIQDLVERTKAYFMLALALYLSSLLLKLSEGVSGFLRTLVIVVMLVQIAFWCMRLIDYLVRRQVKADPDIEADRATTMGAVSLVLKIALWSIVVLLILENVTGIEMNTLLATLGVGGIAVALAVQNILGDLFSSVSIALDKPFVIGDSITVGEHSGTVEHIGLKSTRVRSVSGEQIVFSNSDLLSSRILNFRQMEYRRVAFTLGVTYQTPHEKLASVPGLIQKIIESHEGVTFERAYFKSFGDFALLFECSYYVDVPDFQFFTDTQQAINLALNRRFEEEGIEFAYPTHTVFVQQ